MSNRFALTAMIARGTIPQAPIQRKKRHKHGHGMYRVYHTYSREGATGKNRTTVKNHPAQHPTAALGNPLNLNPKP